MLTKKLSFAAMLAASVTSSVALNAGFDQNGNLSISAKKLKAGHDSGELTLKSGQKFKVEGFLDPIYLSWDKEKFYGVSLGQNLYNFSKDLNGYELDPITGEIDYSKPIPGPVCMHLTLTLLTGQESSLSTGPVNVQTQQAPVVVRTSLKEAFTQESTSSSAINPSKEELKEDQEEEAKPQSTSHAKFTVIEEKLLENTAPQKIFHSQQDPKTGLFTNLEYLTPAAIKWWLSRLGAEAFFEFSNEIEHLESEHMNLPDEQRMSMEQSHNEFAQNWGAVTGASFGSYNPLSEELQDAKSLMSYYNRSDKNLNQRQFTFDSSSYMSGSLMPAWRGFQYNLEHAGETPTWVSYMTTQEIKGPLHETNLLTSPEILMAMTATVSSSFYSPLGIYRSPISVANAETGKHKNLSLKFHSATAQMMEAVNPDYKYVVVRPLASMKTIFDKSGIAMTQSDGSYQSTDNPYVRVCTPHQHLWYAEDDTLTTQEKELFGSEDPYGQNPFILVDSRNNTYTQIGWNHPFSSSQFLGGMSRENFAAFPFVTIKREDLVKFSK